MSSPGGRGISTHGMRKQTGEDPEGVHHRNDQGRRLIHDRYPHQARRNLLVDPFRVGSWLCRAESRGPRDYLGALLQSANPRLSRGRIRDLNYEIL
jgi:hypothetical protein